MAKNNKLYDGVCKDAVVFARVSSQEQELGASIDAQLKSVFDYCAQKNLNVVKEFVLTESSTRGDRKQYQEMLDFVKTHKGKIAIIVNCVDRLQRSYKDTPALDDMRKIGKIEVHFLKENLILHKDSTGMEIMFWNMSVLMANNYVLALADNVKRSLNFNWSQGKWQGFAPIGYKNVLGADSKADIVIDEDRAPIIKHLFEEYSKGTHSLKSLLEIAKKHGLTSRRVPSKIISRAHIQNILTNPFYYGEMRIKGEIKPHIYQPIISKELFDAVQLVMHGKQKNEFRITDKELPFMFRGLIKCSTCGGMITSEQHTTKKGAVHTYLKCNHNKGECHQGLVKESDLIEQLNEQVFNKINIDESFVKDLQEGIKQYLMEEDGLDAMAKKDAKTRLTNLRNKKSRLFDLFLERVCDKQTYDEKMLEIDKEIRLLEEKNESLNKKTEDIKKMVEDFGFVISNIKNIMNGSIISKKREILKLILSNAVLDGKSLCFDLKKPFDKLLFAKGCKLWLGQLDSNQ